MYKQLIWVINKIIIIFLLSLSNVIIKKDRALVLFGSKLDEHKNESFIHNSKYLFLYLQKYSDIHPVWLCNDKKMINTLKKYGLKDVYSRNSIKGILSILKAKFWIYDITANQVSHFNAKNKNVIFINLWHGIPLKKIGVDASLKVYNFDKNSIKDKIYRFLRKTDDFYIVNGKYDSSCFQSAFKASEQKIKYLGSPRNDVLINEISNAEIFMEKDFNNIVSLKKTGKKLIIYMPTFRDTGKDISQWLNSCKLKDFLKKNNTVLICKLHPLDKNLLNINLAEEFYKMDNTSDIYPILKYSDALVTDYSSVYFDYLLLDKPIVHYVPDLEEYQEKCRGFYKPFKNLIAGSETHNEQELLLSMQKILDGVDEFKEKRNILRNELFIYQDGQNCNRIYEFLKKIKNS